MAFLLLHNYTDFIDLIIKFPLILLILEFELNFASKIKMGM